MLAKAERALKLITSERSCRSKQSCRGWGLGEGWGDKGGRVGNRVAFPGGFGTANIYFLDLCGETLAITDGPNSIPSTEPAHVEQSPWRADEG